MALCVTRAGLPQPNAPHGGRRQTRSGGFAAGPGGVRPSSRVPASLPVSLPASLPASLRVPLSPRAPQSSRPRGFRCTSSEASDKNLWQRMAQGLGKANDGVRITYKEQVLTLTFPQTLQV